MLENELSEASKASNKVDKENTPTENISKPTSQEIEEKPGSGSNITNPDPYSAILSEAEFNTIRDNFLEKINESVIMEMEGTAKKASQFAAERMDPEPEAKEEVKVEEQTDVVETEEQVEPKESSEVVENQEEQAEPKEPSEVVENQGEQGEKKEQEEEDILEFKEDTKNGYTS